MTKMTREEVLKIAQISKLEILEEEIEPIIKHLEAVLSYAERVNEIASDVEVPSDKKINVFREDIVVSTDPEPILSQAPDREDDFFVVPKIIEN